MSQALLLRVKALEDRVAELELELSSRALDKVVEEFDPHARSFEPFHKGWGHFGVRASDGTEVGTEALTKEDAKSFAEELNEQTKVMA